MCTCGASVANAWKVRRWNLPENGRISQGSSSSSFFGPKEFGDKVLVFGFNSACILWIRLSRTLTSMKTGLVEQAVYCLPSSTVQL